LVCRCERTSGRSDIEESTVGGRFPPDVLGQIGERHNGLALGEGRQRPFRYTQHAQARQREASPENLPTGALVHHDRSLSAAASLTCSTILITTRTSRAIPCRIQAATCRSEEHTSELQSRVDLVCRLLLEKKKK